MEGDEIRALFNGEDPEEIDIPENPLLTEVLELLHCDDLLPFASRILWLSAVKEAVGYIPDYIDIDYEELRGLVVLQEEREKKMAYSNFQMREETKRSRQNNNVDLSQVVKR